MLQEFITGLSWLVARVGSEEFIALLHIKFGPRSTQQDNRNLCHRRGY